MGKFLRIFFGCHCRPDRSFFWRGKQFPICARCTGELIGILGGIPIIFAYGYAGLPLMALLMAPMVADGLIQLLTSYESTNLRRLLTGILFGIAFDSLLIHFHRTCVYMAGALVKLFTDNPAAVERAMERFM